MKPAERESSGDDLQRQREVLRRNFIRANTAVAVILIALLALAVAAVLASLKAGRNETRAEAANRESQEQLARTLRTQARVLRLSGQTARRSQALQAVRSAAALRPSTELRNEAVACLALPDLVMEQFWPEPLQATALAFDRALGRRAACSDGRHIELMSTTSNAPSLWLNLEAVTTVTNRAFFGLTFSPGGRYLTTRLHGGGVVVWESASGRIVFNTATNRDFMTSGMPSFTRDEQQLFFSEPLYGTNLLRADLSSGAVSALPVPITPWHVFKVHPEGQRVAVVNQNVIEIRNLENGRREQRWEEDSNVAALAWSDSGHKLAAGCANGDVSIWDLESGNERQLNGHTAAILAVQFSPGGERLCTAAWDGTSRLWEADSGHTLLTMEGEAVQFSASGKRLAFYQCGVGVGVWRLSPGVGYRVLGPAVGRPVEGWRSDLSPDGRWLALAKPEAIQVWDLDSTNSPAVMAISNLFTTFWHPTEPALFLVRDGHIESRAVSASPENQGPPLLGSPNVLHLPAKNIPFMAALSRDGHTLAFVDSEGELFIGDARSTNGFVQVAGRAHASGPLGSGSLTGSGRLAVSPDGQWVATVDMEHTPAPNIFEARTGKLVKVLPTVTAAVGFSPDGRWLATCDKAEFALWSVGDWTQVWRRPRSGLPSVEGGVAISGDGSLVAVTKSQDVVALLDRATGDELVEFTPPDLHSAAGLRLNAGARRIVVPTLDNRIQVWEVNTIRQELAGLGLDWGQTLPTETQRPIGSRLAWANPAVVILFGLACVTSAAFFALRALGRHRRLLQQFVQSEAEAQRRRRELEVAKVELMHSQKMQALGTLAAGIAHDFNNLLSVIRMSNKLIGRATAGDGEVVEEVTNIEEAVQQGKQVVASMLGYSRQPAEGDEQCDLDEVVEETVSLLSREFLSGIQLTLALDRDAPVRVGRGRIEQILLNLVVNAAEAMKGRGKLEIAVHRARLGVEDGFVLRPRGAGPLVELRVADSGPGIAPEILPRIFEPFFTTKTAGTKQGTGLGLSMVYTIAEQEGFGIAVDSTLGGGATFRILLPACAPEAQFPEAVPCG